MVTSPRARFDPADLAAHADAVRGLAARIVADRSLADDVVQQACLAALERPPAAATPKRAWFVAVVRNLAFRARRDAARRDRRELAAARPATQPSPGDVAERIEAHRRIVDAVAALDEPYRSAIVMRYFEGLAPAEMATRLGVPVATVNTHVHRGVAKLRARLASDDDERGRRLLLLVALPIPRPAPLVPAGGLLVMASQKLVAAGAALVLALLVGWIAVSERSTTPRGSPPVAGTTTIAAGGRAHIDAPAPAPALELPPSVDLAKVDRDLDLHGRVTDSSGRPVAGADVATFTRPWTRTRTMIVEHRRIEVPGIATRTGADGTFALRLRRGDRVDLRVRADGHGEVVRPSCLAGERIDVMLSPTVAIVVAVTDAGGAPVPETKVSLLRGDEAFPGEPRLEAEGLTGPDGICRLAGLPPGAAGGVLSVRHPQHGMFWSTNVDAPRSGEARVDVVLRPRRTVRGTIRDQDSGAPVAGARVSESWTMESAVTADERGEYALPATDAYQVCAAAPGYGNGSARIGTAARVDVTLRRAARVTGRVVGADGRRVPGACIVLCGESGDDGSRSHADTTSAPDGTFSFDLRATDPFVLVFLAPGHGRTLLDVDAVGAPGGARDLGDVSLAPPRRLSGRVLLPDGSPCRDALVRLTGANADRARLRPEAGPLSASYGTNESSRTDDLGRFHFGDLAPAKYELEAVSSGRKNAFGSVVVGESDVDDAELRFVGGTRLAVRVLDDAGRPVGACAVSAATSDTWTLSWQTDADGRLTFDTDARITSLQAIPIAVGLAPKISGDAVRVAEGTTEVTLGVRRCEWARGTCVGPEGKPLPSVRIDVLENGKPLWQQSPFETGAWVRESGDFEVLVPLGSRISLVLRDPVLPAAAGARPRALVGRLDDVAPGADGLVLRAGYVPGGRALDVVVQGPDGTPEPGARVHAMFVGGQRLPVATASRTGRARLEDLDEARIFVWAELERGHPGRERWISARAEVVPKDQEVTLRFREGRTLRASVVDASGTPAVGATVSLYSQQTQLATATTDASGRFAFPFDPGVKRPLYLYVYLVAPGRPVLEYRDAAFEPAEGEMTIRLAAAR